MDYLKIMQSLLALILFTLTVVNAQDFLEYDDASDYRGRIPITAVRRYRRQGNVNDSPDAVVRPRRQDGSDGPRYRRQGGGGEGVTGPVHTFVKTDEHAHFKWGVRHHVGHEYAGR